MNETMKKTFSISLLALLTMIPACADADAALSHGATEGSDPVFFSFVPEEYAPGKLLEFGGALSRPLVDPEDGEPVRVVYLSYRMPRSGFATMEVVACDDAESLMGNSRWTEAERVFKLHPRPGLTWGEVEDGDDVVLEVEPLTPGGD